MKIAIGFGVEHIDDAAELYWNAFGPKLNKVLGPRRKALAYIERVMDRSHCLAATRDGNLLGIAGFKTARSAFVGGQFADMFAVYGFGSLWRSAFLTLLSRDIENERFLIDGIFVAEDQRGKGIGTELLNRLTELAASRGYREIRLDVVDTNPRARALYERIGFREVNAVELGVLRHVFGFKSSSTLVRTTDI